jgi:hypothetical protein
MREQFFIQPKVLRRLQEGVFGPYLPAFSESLQQEEEKTRNGILSTLRNF